MLREDRERIRYDYILIATILLLTLLGLVILYSASYLFAHNQPRRFASGWTPLVGNIAAFVIMMVLFPIFALMKLEWLKNGKLMLFLLLVTVGLNMLPFLSYFQKATYDSGTDVMRWITLKKGGKEFISFQPSETIKVILPLYLTYILDKNKDRIGTFMYGPLPPLFVTSFFCIIVLLQSNFSDAALIAMTSLIICFAAGIRLRWFVMMLPVIIIAAFVLISNNDRWAQRMDSHRNKQELVSSQKTQIDFSKEAIQSGGFWGKGIGQGTLKVRMPEVHGDFVFASYVEESGFLGLLFYLVLIGVFAWIGYLIAWRGKDRFTQLLAFGLVTPIIIQTLLNIAVVAGIIPVTGVPLPFISSGGSSLLLTLIGSALLVNVVRRYVIHDTMGRK